MPAWEHLFNGSADIDIGIDIDVDPSDMLPNSPEKQGPYWILYITIKGANEDYIDSWRDVMIEHQEKRTVNTTNKLEEENNLSLITANQYLHGASKDKLYRIRQEEWTGICSTMPKRAADLMLNRPQNWLHVKSSMIVLFMMV